MPTPPRSMRPCFSVLYSTVLLLTIGAGQAAAQSQVVVIRDGATVWRVDAALTLSVIPENVILDVVGRSPGFVHVRIPEGLAGAGQIGRISLAVVRTLEGAELAAEPPADAQPVTPPRIVQRQAVRLRGVGQAGAMFWTARDSFEAIFGRSYAPQFGGGAQVAFRNGFFAEGTLQFTRMQGERVFVFQDQVFPLGIEETLTVIPVTATVGYRFLGRETVPYIGGGVSWLSVRDESDFDAADETISERHVGWHASAGVEFRSSRAVAFAVEAQYLLVPDALGQGVSQAFGENDLGGLRAQFKVLFGQR